MTSILDLKTEETAPIEDALPAYAWPGGYQINYYTVDGDLLCAECANYQRDQIEDNDIYWEGPDMYCADCNCVIHSECGNPWA